MDRRVPDRGSRVGNYLVEEEIGRGGMGVVYRATHIDSGAVVALKLMAPELAGNARYRERFQREAELGPVIGHPHVVPVYEAGESDGDLYIAMELIDGPDLKLVVEEEGALETKRVVRIFRQAASALDAAHEGGVVHRDVKPQNMLIRSPGGSDEKVFLSDFGLVKPVTSETTATRTGQIFGSIPYIAPEMIEGVATDGRADVYSLGCVLYECLTGEVPFQRENEIATIWAHIHEDPPRPSNLRRDVAPGVDDVIVQALAKHPDDRFLTCGEMVDALEESLGRRVSRLLYSPVRPLVERVPRKKTEREVWAPNFFPELSRVRKASREKLSWKTLAASIVVVVLLSGLQFGRDGGIPRAVADAADVAGSSGSTLIEKVFGGSGASQRPEGFSDGPGAAAAELPSNLRRRATEPRVPLAGAGTKALEGTGAGDLAAPDAEPFTPRRLPTRILIGSPLFGARGGYALHTLAPGKETPVMLFDSGSDDYDPASSPDGTRVAFILGTRLSVIDRSGTGLRSLTPASGWARQPTWSPDGKRIAFAYSASGITRDREGWGIYTIEVDNPRVMTAVSPALSDMDPAWSPDGRRIAFTSSRDDPDGDVFVSRPDGSDLRIFAGGPGAQRQPVWSPTGDAIAFSAQTSSTSGFDIYVKGFTEGDVRRVTNLHRAFAPVFSPDGRSILFVGGYTSSNKQNQGLFLMKVRRGGGVARRITRANHWDDVPDWR